MYFIRQIYRKLFCQKGYGVHSPFVFDLITSVIEEKCAFYSFHDFVRIRQQLSQNKQFVRYRGKRISVKKALQRDCISKKEGEFLFRLTNHYKPQTILSVGSSLGLAPLCLSKYASSVRCVTLENEPDFADIAIHVLNNETNLSLPIRTGNYRKTIPEAIEELQRIDCIFIEKDVEISDLNVIFSTCLPFTHDNTCCIWAGIRSTSEKYHYWKRIYQHPSVTVAVDLYHLGLLFLQPKLHKRVYKTILP